jgi:hypothetical protein
MLDFLKLPLKFTGFNYLKNRLLLMPNIWIYSQKEKKKNP